MLDNSELDAAIASFISRKQKQFPDINLSDNHYTRRLARALRHRSGRLEKDYRPLRHDIKLA